jgi:two-component system phosphate regulon response regulator OmpR
MTFAERPHILIVDDDDRIRELLSRFLMNAGYVVVSAPSALDASQVLQALEVDLIVLDIMMPGMTGVEWTKALRAAGDKTPILLLTAMGDAPDRIKGLEAGADDYLAKPFEPRELQLRIDAILRRVPDRNVTPTRFSLGAWDIDLAREELVGGDGIPQKLTGVEIKLLRVLVEQAGQVVRRDDLAVLCGVNPDERTIDVQITRLRRKLNDDPKQPKYIATVRGQGYQILADSLQILGGA